MEFNNGLIHFNYLMDDNSTVKEFLKSEIFKWMNKWLCPSVN